MRFSRVGKVELLLRRLGGDLRKPQRRKILRCQGMLKRFTRRNAVNAVSMITVSDPV